MANLPINNIFSKIKLPPCGFVLQRDIYTTNLLYANNMFPLKSLRKRLPFRSNSKLKMENLNHSIRIYKKKENSLDESEKNYFYFDDLKKKPLIQKKIKLPFPKIQTLPLNSINLHENINKKEVKIKHMEDDLNITSNNGKKIYYEFKTNNKRDKSSSSKMINLPVIFRHRNNKLKNSFHNILLKRHKKNDNNISMDKKSLSSIINEINKSLRYFRQNENNRKRSFIKDNFFSTQIEVENVIDSNNKVRNNQSSIIMN